MTTSVLDYLEDKREQAYFCYTIGLCMNILQLSLLACYQHCLLNRNPV